MALHPAVLAAALCLTFSVTAHADDSQRDACTPDAMRLCRADVSNVARTTACLVAHRAQLSATCRDVFAFAEPAAYSAPAQESRPRLAGARPGHAHVAHPHSARARVAQPYREHRRVYLTRRAFPYHVPRFDQAEAEAEVHTQYRYRTPYLPYWVFP